MEESNDKSTPYLPNEHNMKNGYVTRIMMRKNPCLALPACMQCSSSYASAAAGFPRRGKLRDCR